MNVRELRTRKKLSKIYMKIFASFAILAVPVFLISFFMISHASNLLRNEFKSKLEDSFLHNILELDNNLNLTRTSLTSIFYNPDYLKFFQPYDKLTPEVLVEIKQITHVMSNAKAVSSDHLDSVFYYMDDKKVYNRDGIDDFETFFSSFNVYKGYPSEYWKSRLNERVLKKATGPVEITVALQNTVTEKKVIAYETSVLLNGNSIIMVINFNYEKVVNAITANSLFSETMYLVLDKENNTVFSTLPENISSENIATILSDQNKYFISSGDLNLLDYKVMAVTPVKTFDRYISGTFLLLLSACIAFAVTGIFIAIAFSNSIYRPISRISEFVTNNTEIQSHFLSRKSELDVIESGLEYLVEQNSQYKDNMLKVMEKYMEASIMNSINNDAPVNQQLFDTLFAGVNDQGERYFCCFSIIFQYTESFHKDLDEKRKLNITGTLKTLLYSTFSEHFHCAVIEYEQSKFICITSSMKQDICSKLRITAEVLEKYLADSSDFLTFYFGAGQVYNNPCLLRAFYIQSATALVKAYHHTGEAVHFLQESEVSSFIEMDREDSRRITQLLDACDYDELEDIIRGLVKKNIDRCLSHDRMLNLFMQLAEIGQSYIRSQDYEYSKQLQEYANELKRSIVLIEPDYSDKISLVMTLYIKIIERKRQESDKQLNALMESIKAYIREHYRENIYLETVSSHFNISAKYLSRRFKEMEETNFVDFINRIRIESAESMLKETELKVEEIAEKVGLPSKTTFIRLFKKYTAMIPSQYRSLYREKQFSSENSRDKV